MAAVLFQMHHLSNNLPLDIKTCANNFKKTNLYSKEFPMKYVFVIVPFEKICYGYQYYINCLD